MPLSIVSTLYKSEKTVVDFISQCQKAAIIFGATYELILVDDGSPDSSVELVKELMKSNEEIVLIELSRNFGQHQAVRTGLEYTTGEMVFVLDSDLDEDPKCLHDLQSALTTESADLAYGVRQAASPSRLTSGGFYRLFNALSPFKVTPHSAAARLMTRRFVDAFLAMEEREAFLPGLFTFTGFKQVAVPINKTSESPSSYSTFRRYSLALSAITSFSSRPLHYVFAVGLLILSGSIIGVIITAFNHYLNSTAPDILTMILFSVWAIGGMLLSAIGLLSLYVSRIFDEVKRRPNTIIKTVHDSRK